MQQKKKRKVKNDSGKEQQSNIEAFFTNEHISIPAHSKGLLKYINIHIYYIHFKSKI